MMGNSDVSYDIVTMTMTCVTNLWYYLISPLLSPKIRKKKKRDKEVRIKSKRDLNKRR